MFQLRWYQEAACNAAWSHLCNQPGNAVIVLPTGAGKSVVIAELARRAHEAGGRSMILAHRKELLSQNAEKIAAFLPPLVPCGLYSAGLRRYATDDPIVCAGIQSVYNKAELFGRRNLVLVDEVHLVPNNGEGMYRTFIDNLRSINPNVRLIGLTATPYRTGEGSLCRPDSLFQRICYEAPITKLIAGGFLSKIISQPADAEHGSIDTSKLHIRGGEFVPGEMERAFSHDPKIRAACKEIAAYTHDRKSVLIFCAGVHHADRVATVLQELTGEYCGVVTGNTTPLERASLLDRFKRRELKYLCNVDVLTTGFDAPCIDAIAILRATNSPGLFAQICGRGFRLFPGKDDCLVLDFGENIQRHGPLDSPEFGKRKDKKSGDGESDAPTKKCPNCETDCPISALECKDCGWKFPPREIKHGNQADKQNQILATPKQWLVESVRASRHRKRKAEPDAPDTLRIDYLCKPADAPNSNLIETISEWVCMDHDGWARAKAWQWWRKRSKAKPEPIEQPSGMYSYIDSCVDLFERGAVALPTQITTLYDGRFHRITAYQLEPIPDDWAEPITASVPDSSDECHDPWTEESDDIPF